MGTKRPCRSNPRTSLSCSSNLRSSKNSAASPPVRGGGCQMFLEAQEQGVRLVGARKAAIRKWAAHRPNSAPWQTVWIAQSTPKPVSIGPRPAR